MSIGNKKNNSQSGFTLTELLVAITIFVVIVTFSLGSVVSILDAGRKAKVLKDVMTNMNFTFEVMSRELKFGTHYHCASDTDSFTFPPSPSNCSSGNDAISFVTSDGYQTVYRQKGNKIEKSSDGGVTYVSVTSPDIIIQSLKFYVFGSAPQSVLPPDNTQPRVIIVIKGYSGNKSSIQSNFVLQTTVSQRAPDLSINSFGAKLFVNSSVISDIFNKI